MQKARNDIEELRKRHQDLINLLCPLAVRDDESVLAGRLLRDFSPLADSACRSNPAGRLASALCREDPELEKVRLEAETAAMNRLAAGESEAQAEWGPGFCEFFHSVVVRGRVLHCLTLGPVRKRTAGAEPAQYEGAESVSGLGQEELAWRRRLTGIVARLIEYLLLQELRAREALAELNRSARVRAIGELASGVAHHFNNILSVVLGYTTFVLNKEELSPELSGPLEKVIDAAMRGRRLTSELLRFASVGAEEDQVVNVQEVFGTVLSLLEAQTGGRVTVETSFGARQDAVRAPAGAIHKLVYNLLAASFESMPSGGKIRVRTSNVSMDTELGMQNFLKVVVTDTGGFVPQRSAVTPEMVEASSSTFLLSDVYGIVGTLEGTISVSSRPGKETRVEILLPIVEQKKRAARPITRRTSEGRRVVWVIDDDARFREMCRVVLGEAGYQVEEFSDGRTAVKELEGGQSADVLLLDYSMPELNGLEFCQRLDRLKLRIPVVIVSGLGPENEGIRALQGRRSTFYLQKPFASKELLDTVTLALGETLIGVPPA